MSDSINLMLQQSMGARARVIAFMKAIEDLRPGDLEIVLDLDTIAPMTEDCPTPRPSEAQTGQELAAILEDWLATIQAIWRNVESRFGG